MNISPPYSHSDSANSANHSSKEVSHKPVENVIGEMVNSFSEAILRYSCDEVHCHIAQSEFELVDYDTLSR
ncbi:MAG: hypothetical protein P1U85_02150 [Verrucomicrobiales bacterium]|nr:hypothetical protein [Verrucomicrobiales bacterium]